MTLGSPKVMMPLSQNAVMCPTRLRLMGNVHWQLIILMGMLLLVARGGKDYEIIPSESEMA